MAFHLLSKIRNSLKVIILGFVSLSFWQCSSKVESSDMPFGFLGDSGFITNKTAIQIAQLFDQENPQLKCSELVSDTTGKYYRKPGTSHWVVFLIRNVGEEKCLFQMELDSGGRLLFSEWSGYGNYNCWTNELGGFGKIQNYFFTLSCGSGTSYRSETLTIFQGLAPEDAVLDIPVSIYNGQFEFTSEAPLYGSLNSNLEFGEKQVLVHYEWEKGKIGSESRPNQVLSTKSFSIGYVLKNNSWKTRDTLERKFVEELEL